MEYWFATVEDDLDLLAEWNLQLIEDEGHRNPMMLPELRNRMQGWLEGEYKAVVFGPGASPLAYALYREDADEIYLRQLFVGRGYRSGGIGREIMNILRAEVWPANKRVTVEVLTNNLRAVAFWHTVGCKDYALTLEMPPGDQGQ
jgi:GNAT superfamily N-acetyltransferase